MPAGLSRAQQSSATHGSSCGLVPVGVGLSSYSFVSEALSPHSYLLLLGLGLE